MTYSSLIAQRRKSRRLSASLQCASVQVRERVALAATLHCLLSLVRLGSSLGLELLPELVEVFNASIS